MPRASLQERFEAKVERIPFHPCWEWTGARQGPKHGPKYGHLWAGDKLERAHRVSYELYVGPIPDGLDIDHLCNNRLCVNPDHLEPVTRSVNQLRAAERRGPQSSFRCGHLFGVSNWYKQKGGRRRCRCCDRSRRPRRMAVS